MITKTKTYECYSYDELEEHIKEKVIENNYEINIFEDWYEPIEENTSNELLECGITTDKFYFSLSYSQGDGASFTGKIDLIKYIKSQKLEKYYYFVDFMESQGDKEYELNIYQRGYYYHEYTMNLEDNNSIDFDEKAEKQFDEIYELALDFCRKKASELFSRLREEYEFFTSNQSIEESIRDNNFLFLKDGTIFRDWQFIERVNIYPLK